MERFRLVRDGAQKLGLPPFDPTAEPMPEQEQLRFDESLSVASFFSHGIGGLMTAIRVHMYTSSQTGEQYDLTFFNGVQQDVFGKVERYKTGTFVRVPYEAAVVGYFSDTAFSFR